MYFQALSLSSIPILVMSYLLLASTPLSSSSVSSETNSPAAPLPVSMSVQSMETLDSQSTEAYKIVRVLVAMDFNYTEKVKDTFSPQALVFSVLGAFAPSEDQDNGKSHSSSVDSLDKLNPITSDTIWEAPHVTSASEVTSSNKVERKREAIFPPGMENLFKKRVTRSEPVEQQVDGAADNAAESDSTRVHTHEDDHESGDSHINDHDHEKHHHRHARDGIASAGTRARPCLKASHTHEDHHKDGDSEMAPGHKHEDHDHEHTPRCRRHVEERTSEEEYGAAVVSQYAGAGIPAEDSMEAGEVFQDLDDYGPDDEELAKFLNIHVRSKVTVAKENRSTTAVRHSQEKPLAGNDITIIQG